MIPRILTLLAVAVLPALSQPARPNVLFIAVDDLRAELGCYGKDHISSPNIDRFAASGLLFDRAYCMVPVCGASRSSLMTGIRPAPNRFVGFTARADEDAPGVTTLNTHFKANGYQTLSIGKIFHIRADSIDGWTERPWHPGGPMYALPENRKLEAENKKARETSRGPAWESADVEDDFYGDGKVAAKTIGDLRRLKDSGQPFFMAMGLYKPHLPFVAPKKYWDLYPAETIKLPSNNTPPENAPAAAIHNFGELRHYAGIPPKGPVDDDTARNLIRGYYACVSYIDAQIGRVLDELRNLGLADNTIVVLWSDHGFFLQEHSMWCKHACFEDAMRIPMIVRVPGMKGGERTPALVESIDIYPALCELASIPAPAHLDGKSFVPLLSQPDQKWKPEAVGRYMTGDTIRTDRFRFSEYSNKQGRPTARMLYDLVEDPNETVNISEAPTLSDEVTRLETRLRCGKGKDVPTKEQP